MPATVAVVGSEYHCIGVWFQLGVQYKTSTLLRKVAVAGRASVGGRRHPVSMQDSQSKMPPKCLDSVAPAKSCKAATDKKPFQKLVQPIC